MMIVFIAHHLVANDFITSNLIATLVTHRAEINTDNVTFNIPRHFDPPLHTSTLRRLLVLRRILDGNASSA